MSDKHRERGHRNAGGGQRQWDEGVARGGKERNGPRTGVSERVIGWRDLVCRVGRGRGATEGREERGHGRLGCASVRVDMPYSE